jgi:hypothetical protein
MKGQVVRHHDWQAEGAKRRLQSINRLFISWENPHTSYTIFLIWCYRSHLSNTAGAVVGGVIAAGSPPLP